MRNVTYQIVKSFISGEDKSVSNSRVISGIHPMYNPDKYPINKKGGFITKLELHGNTIALKQDGELYITNAGWPTNTTKERLNGLPGVSIQQKKGVWYLNGEEWSGEWIKVQ